MPCAWAQMSLTPCHSREGRQRGMRRAADEIDCAIAQRCIGLVHREDQLERDIEPFLAKKPDSIAASAGKYELEIMSGTASFMRIPVNGWMETTRGEQDYGEGLAGKADERTIV